MKKKISNSAGGKLPYSSYLYLFPIILPLLKASSDLAMKYFKMQPEQSISSISQLLPH